jgi:hypothetical protein
VIGMKGCELGWTGGRQVLHILPVWAEAALAVTSIVLGSCRCSTLRGGPPGTARQGSAADSWGLC